MGNVTSLVVTNVIFLMHSAPILKSESFELKWLSRFFVKMLSEEKLKQRAIIQTMEMLNRSTKKPSVVRSLEYKWHKRYSEGCETIMDYDRCGKNLKQLTLSRTV